MMAKKETKPAQHVWVDFWHWKACKKCGVLKNPEGADEPCDKAHSTVDLSQTWSKPEPVPAREYCE